MPLRAATCAADSLAILPSYSIALPPSPAVCATFQNVSFSSPHLAGTHGSGISAVPVRRKERHHLNLGEVAVAVSPYLFALTLARTACSRPELAALSHMRCSVDSRKRFRENSSMMSSPNI
jgi:hypothetical protein